jgi:hypothetical protein
MSPRETVETLTPRETVEALTRFHGRAPCSDAERRAGRWLAARLRDLGRQTETETHWVRPQWELIFVLHALAAIAASLISTEQHVVGVAVLGALTLSFVVQLSGRWTLLGLIMPRRATQNVIGFPPAGAKSTPRLRLIVTAAYDAGRSGLVYREGLRRLLARLTRGHPPRGAVLMLLSMIALTAVAAARTAGVDADWLNIAQFVPTLVLVLAVALVLDIWLSQTVPGAGDPASGAAVALALAAALDRAPPRELEVQVVLTGAAEGSGLGLRAFLRRHRRELPPRDTALLHLAACGRGRPRWWRADGLLVPLRYHPRLVGIAERVARDESHLGARPVRGRGTGGAYPARAAGLPAITVGCLDEECIVPASRQHSDTAAGVDSEALDAALEFCLALVDRLDADLATPAG